jgi:2-polyprenyl-3-methyl-5-hydroxy-6-metoxy-1,4-benzoquinol methylase
MGPSDAPVILEIGCSSGFMLMLARERLPNARWIGSDYVRGPLEKLAAEVPQLPLLHFDLRTCPLPDDSVDAVLLLNVLEHIDDDALAMHQVHRILRPGGVAVIEVPARPELYDVYDELLMHHRRYTGAGLRQLLLTAGFEISRFSHLGTLLYPLFTSSNSGTSAISHENKHCSETLSLVRSDQLARTRCQVRCSASSYASDTMSTGLLGYAAWRSRANPVLYDGPICGRPRPSAAHTNESSGIDRPGTRYRPESRMRCARCRATAAGCRIGISVSKSSRP